MTRRVLAAEKVICMDAAGSTASWVALEGGLITEVGRGDPPPLAEKVPGVILPGLIDAHIHLTTTGLYASGLDLREARSIPELLRMLEEFTRRSDVGWIIGGNFDPGRNRDGRMPTSAELDSVAADRSVLISRADGHSCSMNRLGWTQADLDPDLAGIERGAGGEPTGVVSNQANYQARNRFFSAMPPEQIRDAQLAACDVALRRGVTCVQEMAGGSFMGDRDFDVLIANRDGYPIRVVPYLATFDFDRVVDAGLGCIGGDLFLDGSIGSHTAAMSARYEDSDTVGSLYHDDEAVTDFFYGASVRELQAGVHAIGDAAVEQAIRCIEAAFQRLGDDARPKARALRHRIEHFECTDAHQLERAVSLGVAASVQPMFDRYWGGPDGMYRARLGDRAEDMNPFSQMLERGMLVAGGSDSTVTPLDPFLGMAAAIDHHNPRLGVRPYDALRMFTISAAEAAHLGHEIGSIEPGKSADLCVVTADPLELDPAELSVLEVVQTWRGGELVWSA